MNHDHAAHDAKPKGFWSTRYAIGLIVLGAIGGYFVLTEHRAHFLGALPLLVLLACPLMHVFMHHGHGGHEGLGGDSGGENNQPDSKPQPSPSPVSPPNVLRNQP